MTDTIPLHTEAIMVDGGNCVIFEVEGHIVGTVPAVNIQVGTIYPWTDDQGEMYGEYFEVLNENKLLVIVESAQTADGEEAMNEGYVLSFYENWDQGRTLDPPDNTMWVPNAGFVLAALKSKL